MPTQRKIRHSSEFCSFHQRTFVAKIIAEFMITDWNVDSKKGRTISGPAFAFHELNSDLFFGELHPPISCQSNQSRSKQKHGGWFGNGAIWRSKGIEFDDAVDGASVC